MPPVDGDQGAAGKQRSAGEVEDPLEIRTAEVVEEFGEYNKAEVPAGPFARQDALVDADAGLVADPGRGGLDSGWGDIARQHPVAAAGQLLGHDPDGAAGLERVVVALAGKQS
jgi:hypothetical protein